MDRDVRFTSSCCQIDAASSPDAMCQKLPWADAASGL